MRYFKEGDTFLTDKQAEAAYKEDYAIKDTQMPFKFNEDGLPPEYLRSFDSWIEFQLDNGTYEEVSVVDFIKDRVSNDHYLRSILKGNYSTEYMEPVSLPVKALKAPHVSAYDIYEFFSHIRMQMCPDMEEDEFFENSGAFIIREYINSPVYKEMEARKILTEMNTLLSEALTPDLVQKLKFDYGKLCRMFPEYFRDFDKIDVWENTMHIRCIKGGSIYLEVGKDYRAVENFNFSDHILEVYDPYDYRFRGNHLKEVFEEIEEGK